MPGRDRISVERTPSGASTTGISASAQPGTGRATRTHMEPMSVSRAAPASPANRPQTPTRLPSFNVKKPRFSSASRA